ncbi:helicase-related protein [Caldicellulosiruptor danielii]|uniref:C-terminal helicase domain-containing protein n=1 Tax=Anaerocellum danielii TaxID=1387557 RepID=A0ABZ0U1N6_9FIRM|nr:C-terminal helicase domain-containing protein [Caldicellulosiruptor danielii]WPX09211.1 C-terminal helicase domain-containing protein [Caldicellulosiruptor danielii]
MKIIKVARASWKRGFGLNITGADVVIHFDAWWNPAVESQATARAHRLGQKNVVQSFKIIAKNSIEEKILHLQQKKKDLFDSLIEANQAFITKLTKGEICGKYLYTYSRVEKK